MGLSQSSRLARCAVGLLALLNAGIGAISAFASQAPPAAASQSSADLPRVSVSQVIKPPEGQRLTMSESGLVFPQRTTAVLVLSVDGTDAKESLSLTFVKSVGPTAVFRSADHGTFVAYSDQESGAVQFMPPVDNAFTPFRGYTPGMTLTLKDIVAIWRTRFAAMAAASIEQFSQQLEDAQAEMIDRLVNIPHPAAGAALKKLGASTKPEMAEKARAGWQKWNEIDAAIWPKAAQPRERKPPTVAGAAGSGTVREESETTSQR